MVTVSKGNLRTFKMKSAKLAKAVPTLDLRRKQLTREMLAWEQRIAELEGERGAVASKMEQCPHAEIDKVVSVTDVATTPLNVAGIMLEEVSDVAFEVKPYSYFMSSPSFDVFVDVRKDLLRIEKTLEVMRASLLILLDELSVTTQRINLFEKRLIPEYDSNVRYISGRLEDGERSTVMVAKIAQKEMLSQGHTFESA